MRTIPFRIFRHESFISWGPYKASLDVSRVCITSRDPRSINYKSPAKREYTLKELELEPRPDPSKIKAPFVDLGEQMVYTLEFGENAYLEAINRVHSKIKHIVVESLWEKKASSVDVGELKDIKIKYKRRHIDKNHRNSQPQYLESIIDEFSRKEVKVRVPTLVVEVPSYSEPDTGSPEERRKSAVKALLRVECPGFSFYWNNVRIEITVDGELAAFSDPGIAFIQKIARLIEGMDRGRQVYVVQSPTAKRVSDTQLTQKSNYAGQSIRDSDPDSDTDLDSESESESVSVSDVDLTYGE